MKKILLFMAVLFASIGASAQSAAPEGYEWATISDGMYAQGGASLTVEDGVNVVAVVAKTDGNEWDSQFFIKASEAVAEGGKFYVSFDYKADAAQGIGTQAHNAPGTYNFWNAIGSVSFTADWQTFSQEITVSADQGKNGGMQSIAFNANVKDEANNYYFKNVVVKTLKVKAGVEMSEITLPVTGVTQTIKVYNNQFSNVAAPLTVVVPAQVSQSWDSQIWFTMSQPLASTAKISLSFDGKASVAKTLAANCHESVDGNGWTSASAFSGAALTSEWNTFSYEFNAAAGIHGFAADLTNGTNEPTYDFKNIKIGATVTVLADQVQETLYNALAAQVKAATEYISATRDELEAIKATAIKTKYVPQLEAEYDNLDGGVKQEIITLYDSNALTSENASKLEDAILAIVAKVAEIKAEATKATAAFYPVAEGDYLIMNAEGGFIGGGTSWGTRATLIGKPQWFTLAEAENGYTLDSHQSNGGNSHYLASGLYCDANAEDWTITAMDEENTIFTISNQSGKYLSAKNGMQGTIELVGEEEMGMSELWAFVPMSKIVADTEIATTKDPVDVTAIVKDPELKRNGNTDGNWTITSYDGTGKPSNWAEGQGGNNVSCAESWHSTNGFKAVQTVTLPKAGLYIFTAQGFVRENQPEVMPYFFAGEEKAEFNWYTGDINNMVNAYAAMLKGEFQLKNLYYVAKEDGEQIEIGFAGEQTSNNWNLFGDVTAMYAGEAPALQQTNPANGGYVEAAPAKLMFMFNQEIAKADIEVANIAVEGQGDMEVAAENIEVIDGNTVVLTSEDLTALPSGSVVYAAVKIYGQSYDMSFTVMEALAVATSGVDEGEVWVKFNQNIDFAEGAAQTATLFAAGEGAEPIEVELTLDEEAFDVLVATLPVDIKAGNYTLQIAAATVMSTVTEMTNEQLSIDVEAEDGPAAGIAESIIEASEALAAVQEKITEDMTEAAAEAEAIQEKLGAAYAAFEAATESEETTAEDYLAIKDSIAAVNEQIAALNDAVTPKCDLTKEMFHEWTAADATGEIVDKVVYPDYNVGTSTGMVYGYSTVGYLAYADLTGAEKLVITSTEGAPRCCFNRVEDNGTVNAETPRDAKYFTEEVVDGVKTTTIDIAAITADYGFAHLHAIKGANWANVTVTSMQIVGTPTAINSISIAAIKNGKFLNNGKIVIVKNGKTYNVAGQMVK